jgi:4-hydroxy-2-oxoheptanedioate aldolase
LENFVKNKINSGRKVVGLWNIIPSDIISEIAATAGFDFQILDMEHGLFDFGSLEKSIRACESTGCSPLVRIGDLNAVAAQRTLDIGVHGLIFPQIKTEDDAKKVVEICNFPPKGVRGFNPFTRANAYGFNDQSTIKRDITDFALTGAIIENLSAQKNLDKILDTQGLDIIYLGAYDMSVALGKPGDMSNPELVEFLQSSVKKIRDQGKTAGVMARNSAEVEMYSKIGANFIVVGVDSYLIGSGMKNLLESLTKSIKN